MSDVYVEIRELETQLDATKATLAELRRKAPPGGTCGNPQHATLADRVASLESLLAKMARGRRTTEKIQAGRGDRLHAEIARVKLAVAKLEPLVAGVDRSLLDRLKRAQQRRRILELKMQQPVTALVASVAPLELGPLAASPSRGRDPGWLALLAAALIALFGVGAATTAGIVMIATLITAVGLADVAFPGARRELVSPHLIYGERWRRVRRIQFRADGTLRIKTAKRRHEFSPTLPGYRDVVRIALAAAQTHKLSVTGDPPVPCALAPLSEI